VRGFASFLLVLSDFEYVELIVNMAINHFLTGTACGAQDLLVVDMPPGEGP
jgi:Mrp family chromosome partitioning ATPase